MPDILLYILSGAGVGLAIGMTGVGGGSLMTPLLILFGFPYNVAIGTDLLYAAATKASGVAAHKRKQSIQWPIVGYLAAGSIPASLLTSYFLNTFFREADAYESILTRSLGIMLILTALVLLFKKVLRQKSEKPPGQVGLFFQSHAKYVTLFSGVFLGVFVTLSSVGAGAFCALNWLAARHSTGHPFGLTPARPHSAIFVGLSITGHGRSFRYGVSNYCRAPNHLSTTFLKDT